jgi:hypothetical protein
MSSHGRRKSTKKSSARNKTPAPPRRNTKKIVEKAVVYTGKGDYKLAKIGGKPVGEFIGGSIGGLFGKTGKNIGRGIGGLIHNGVKLFTGRGDYHAMNQMYQRMYDMDGAGKTLRGLLPMFTNGKDYTEIVREEPVAIVTATQGYTALAFKLNPGDPLTFPVGSREYTTYEQYEIVEAIWLFRSLEANSSSAVNAVMGEVILATDYDPAHSAPTSAMQALAMEGAASNRGSKSVIHYIECDPQKNPASARKYIRNGSTASGSYSAAEIREDDLGTTYVITNGFASNGGVVGELWLSTKIRLYKPIAYSMLTGPGFCAFFMYGYTTASGAYAWNGSNTTPTPTYIGGTIAARLRNNLMSATGSGNQTITISLPQQSASYALSVTMSNPGNTAQSSIAFTSYTADVTWTTYTNGVLPANLPYFSWVTNQSVQFYTYITVSGVNDHTANPTTISLTLGTWQYSIGAGTGQLVVALHAIDTHPYGGYDSRKHVASRTLPPNTDNWTVLQTTSSGVSQYPANGPSTQPSPGSTLDITIAQSEPNPQTSACRMVRVEGLHRRMTELSISKHFSQFGIINDVQLLRDNDFVPTGAALIEFDCAEGALRACGEHIINDYKVVCHITHECFSDPVLGDDYSDVGNAVGQHSSTTH